MNASVTVLPQEAQAVRQAYDGLPTGQPQPSCKYAPAVGDCYFYWEVCGDVFRGDKGDRYVPCKCICGAVKNVRVKTLCSKNTASCGCMWKRPYRTEKALWRAMRHRCDPNNEEHYSRYAERGISVCDRWQDVNLFLADMGARPSSDYTLDRIDNNKGYSPDNCRWATRTTQQNNTRRNRFLEKDGLRMTVAEWSRHLGVSQEMLRGRLKRGWTAEEALNV